MRWLFAILMALVCGPVHCDAGADVPDIATVLDRSQRMRLESLQAADPFSARAQRVRASFDTLVRNLPSLRGVELQVVCGATTTAETLHGRTVVANESLGDLPKGERLFVLAHELGHVMLGHRAQMVQLYQKWVPGPVLRQRTDAIADALGRDASALAHRQEFEADAFGLRILRSLGRPDQDAVAAFSNRGPSDDTATHPSTRKRVAALRSIERGTLHAAGLLAAQD